MLKRESRAFYGEKALSGQQPRLRERKIRTWQKEKQQCTSVRSVDTSRQNGWDSVRDADPGIRSVKKK